MDSETCDAKYSDKYVCELGKEHYGLHVQIIDGTRYAWPGPQFG